MKYELFMALRYLKAKRKQAFISVISIISIVGVALGVMALIVVISVMAGFENHLRSKILGINAHILLRSNMGSFDNVDKIEKIVSSVKVEPESTAVRLKGLMTGGGQGGRVTAVTPIVYIQALINSRGSVHGVSIRGIDSETIGSVMSMGTIVDGKGIENFKNYSGSKIPPIIIGSELAKILGTGAGDRIQVVLPSGTLTPVGMIPKIRTFQITGVQKTGMYEYDLSLALMPIDSARKLLGIKNKAHALEIKTSDIYEADRISKAITEKLGFPFWTMDWQQMSRNLFAAMKLEKFAMFVILTLIVLVAAFNIISTMIMMIMEKNQDIAILKTIGATNGQILRIFMFNGLMIGLMGTLIGVISGTGLCALLEKYKFIKVPSEVYHTDSLPILTNPEDVTAIAISAVIICFIAAIYPARQASKVNPAEALRAE